MKEQTLDRTLAKRASCPAIIHRTQQNGSSQQARREEPEISMQLAILAKGAQNEIKNGPCQTLKSAGAATTAPYDSTTQPEAMLH